MPIQSITGEVLAQPINDNFSYLEANILTKEEFTYYNVKDFGAVGDGNADDSAAIQAVLDLAKPTTNAKPVVVKINKAGNYRLEQTLKIYKNTHLIISEGVKLLRGHGGSVLINGDASDTFTGYNGNGNIVVSGGSWDGNIAEFGTDGFIMFGIAHADKVRFYDVEVRDLVDSHAIDLNSSRDVYIKGCRFLGYKLISNDYVEAIQISTHVLEGFNEVGSFDNTPCQNVTIENCIFGESGTSGTQSYPVGVGNHTAVSGIYNSDIKIINNTFNGMTFAGTRLFQYLDVDVKLNAFNNCQTGVMLSNSNGHSENISIAENDFKGTKREDIIGTSTIGNDMVNIEVKDNTFIDGSLSDNATSVYFTWVDGLNVKGNFHNNVFRAFLFEFIKNAKINSNDARNIFDSEFIMVTENNATYQDSGHTYNIIIDGNRADNVAKTGIYVLHAADFKITGNMLDNVANLDHNLRSGISVQSNANRGFVSQNTVKKPSAGNMNKYGVEVTGSCTNIQTFNNNADGATGKQSNVGLTNFDGFYMYGNTTDTRYKVEIDDSGQFIVSAG